MRKTPEGCKLNAASRAAPDLELNAKFLTRNSHPSTHCRPIPTAYTLLYPLLPAFQLPPNPVAAHHTIAPTLLAFLSDRAAHLLACLGLPRSRCCFEAEDIHDHAGLSVSVPTLLANPLPPPSMS